MCGILTPLQRVSDQSSETEMQKNEASRMVPLLLAVFTPVLAAAVIPWVLFSAIPIEQDTYYELPLAELGGTFVAALLSVGLAAWAVIRSGGGRPRLLHVLVALVSGVASAVILWFVAFIVVITRFQGLLSIWGALLALWAVWLIQSLRRIREQPPVPREEHQEPARTG